MLFYRRAWELVLLLLQSLVCRRLAYLRPSSLPWAMYTSSKCRAASQSSLARLTAGSSKLTAQGKGSTLSLPLEATFPCEGPTCLR